MLSTSSFTSTLQH